MHSLSTNPSSAPIRDGFLPRRAPCCIRRKVNPGAPSTSRSQTEQKRLLIRHSTIHVALWLPHSWTCEKPPCQRFLTFSNSSRTAIAIGLRAPKTLRLPKRASESSRNLFPVSTSLLTIRQAKRFLLARTCNSFHGSPNVTLDERRSAPAFFPPIYPVCANQSSPGFPLPSRLRPRWRSRMPVMPCLHTPRSG